VTGWHPGLRGGGDDLGSNHVDHQGGPPGRVASPLKDEPRPGTGLIARSGNPAVPNLRPRSGIRLERSDGPIAQRNTSPGKHAASHTLIMHTSSDKCSTLMRA
jgi:hypothetical protein